MEIEMTIIQSVTFSIAVLGAVLGIINTWYNLDKNRVKLKVMPGNIYQPHGGNKHLNFCIQITNLSVFPLTISQAGFFSTRTGIKETIIKPVFLDGGNWPKRLEPRTAITVLTQSPEVPIGHKIKSAYAITQCGKTCIGTSGALKNIINKQRKLNKTWIQAGRNSIKESK